MELDVNQLKTKAESGQADAQYELSWRLALGQGVVADDSAAVEWLQKAADGGHRLAWNNLAARYLAGDGVAQDLVAAYCWFQLAAEAGDRKAGKNRDTAQAQMSAEQLNAAGPALAELRRKVRV